jgi:hypothetical protein
MGSLGAGSANWRKALRQRVLDGNAYQCLAQQDRRPAWQAWGFILAVCAFLLGWCAWPRLWPSPLNFYTTAMVLCWGWICWCRTRPRAAWRRIAEMGR